MIVADHFRWGPASSGKVHFATELKSRRSRKRQAEAYPTSSELPVPTSRTWYMPATRQTEVPGTVDRLKPVQRTPCTPPPHRGRVNSAAGAARLLKQAKPAFGQLTTGKIRPPSASADGHTSRGVNSPAVPARKIGQLAVTIPLRRQSFLSKFSVTH